MSNPSNQLSRMCGYILGAIFMTTVPLAGATPKIRTMAVKESHTPPAVWRKMDTTVPNHMCRLYIGLKSLKFDKLDDYLSKSSDPDHEMYGIHLSAGEADEMMAPDAEALEEVETWLQEHGIGPEKLSYTPAKDWIIVNTPLKRVEKMLGTKYSVFEHKIHGHQLIRAPTWSLPQHLHKHIEVIQPTNNFFHPKSFVMPVETIPHGFQSGPSSFVGDMKVCNESFVTFDCLRTFYGIKGYTTQASDKNSMAINNFLNEVSNRSDVALALKKWRPEAAASAYTFKTIVIDNGNNYQGQENKSRLSQGADIEGNLDAETMLGIAWPTKFTTFNTGNDGPTDDIFLNYLLAVIPMPNLPNVISTSYGGNEQFAPASYLKKTCEGFAYLGVRGVSVFFSSGDSGVGESGTCVTNDAKMKPTFLPVFPASCPYVTAVGATRGFKPERVAFDLGNGFVSGGGYSQAFKRPSYQDKLVPPYTKSLGNQFKGLYNPEGRAYPDVAAQGYRYAVVWNGTTITVDGTSASSPLFAATVALVNDALIATGLSTLGFLNPFLYKYGFDGLNDITIGSVSGCNTSGFPAAKGWDAASGLGSPDFNMLVALAKKYGNYNDPSSKRK